MPKIYEESLGKVKYILTEKEDEYVLEVDITPDAYTTETGRNFGVLWSVTKADAKSKELTGSQMEGLMIDKARSYISSMFKQFDQEEK